MAEKNKNKNNKNSKNNKKDCCVPSIVSKMPNRMVVLGDLHADYVMALKCLSKAKVIEIPDDGNEKIKWIGGDTVVVQMGDQVDGCRPFMTKCNECDEDDTLKVDSKCPTDKHSMLNDEDSEVKIMDLFDDLHVQAQKEGGAVYCLIGNHELMNVDGNMKYVSSKNLEYFKKYIDEEKGIKNRCDARRYAFRAGGEFAKRIARTRVAALIVGDWMFLHGGITKDVMRQYRIKKKKDIERINDLVRRWLNGEIERENVAYIIGDHYKAKERIHNPKNTVFWNREMGNLKEDEPKDSCDRLLNEVFETLEINHVVVGHTPQINGCGEGGVNCTCDDRVCRVDVGMSEAFSVVKKERKPQILIVEDGNIIYGN